MRNEAEQPAIRPEDVAARSFAFARKGGYEPREVQDFLRRVGEELRIAQHHAYDLEHTLTIRTDELERARNVDEAEMTRILGLETVKVLEAAREAAAQIRARAETSASEIMEAAQQQADAIRGEASQVLQVRKAEAEAAVADMLREASESLTEAQDAAEAARVRAEAEGEAHLESVRERGREMVGEAQAVRERMLRDLSRRRKALKNQIDQLQAARDRLLAAYEVVRRTTDEASGELEGMLDAARDAAQQAAEQRPAPQGDPDADIIAVIEAVRSERRAELGESGELLEFEPDEPDLDDGSAPDGVAEAAPEPPAEAPAEAADVAAETADDDTAAADGSAAPEEIPAESASTDRGEAEGADAEGGDAAAGGFYDFGSEIEAESDAGSDPDVDGADSQGVELDVDWWEAGSDGEPDSAEDVTEVEVVDVLEVDVVEVDVVAVEVEGEPARSAAGKEAVSLFARLREEASAGAEPAVDASKEEAADEEADSENGDDSAPGDVTDAGEAGAPADAPQADVADVDDSEPDEAAVPPAAVQEPVEAVTDPKADDAAETGETTETAEGAEVAEGPDEESGASPDEELLARRDAALGEVRTTLARRLKRTVADEQNEVLDVLRRHKGKVDLDLVFPVLEEHVERYADASLPTLAAAAAAGAEFVQKGWPSTVRPAPRTRVGDVAEELGIEVVVPLRDAVSNEIERHGDDLDALDEGVREAYRQWKVDTPDAVAGRAASLAFHRALREQVDEGVGLRWIVGDEACAATTLESDPGAVPPVRPGCACLVVPASAPEG